MGTVLKQKLNFRDGGLEMCPAGLSRISNGPPATADNAMRQIKSSETVRHFGWIQFKEGEELGGSVSQGHALVVERMGGKPEHHPKSLPHHLRGQGWQMKKSRHARRQPGGVCNSPCLTQRIPNAGHRQACPCSRV